ncbi:hypothetical protein B7H23_04665 [Notoacmeibacter marinus]|uniref:EamA domain-containing protein n=1 Tax=Notoacmeibacter marinus TaxID=1876515 RepID=A0A231V1Z5_9HYPH|nr:DMT family transporter [Notoacmeibacter marinus]OXT02212.1 hypothetical protein B7H23_04665 [Notoacmeibacter marinus]
MSSSSDTVESRRFIVGAAWAIAGISIWASWMVVTRLDLLTSGLIAQRVGLSGTLIMASGSGLIYVLIGSGGLLFAPANHAGPLIPGTMPLFAALLSVLILGERIDRSRQLGLALIPFGAATILVGSFLTFETGEWRGDLLFLCAAFLWASYTVTLRRAQIGPFHAAALVAVWSAMVFLPVYLFVLPKQILEVPWSAILQQVVFQGILVSVVSLICFNRAVTIIGASRAAGFASLVPILTALMALPVLGEVPSAFEIGALLAVTAGVLLASGAVRVFGRNTRPATGKL